MTSEIGFAVGPVRRLVRWISRVAVPGAAAGGTVMRGPGTVGTSPGSRTPFAFASSANPHIGTVTVVPLGSVTDLSKSAAIRSTLCWAAALAADSPSMATTVTIVRIGATTVRSFVRII